MNKKILAAAVAGALALPSLAFAQAAGVTISGVLAVGFNAQKFSGATPLTTGANPRVGNTSTTRINDEVSIVTFGIVEPLGGGMDAFGQWQVRPCMDGNTTGGTMLVCSANAETFVGLRSNVWGQVKMGSITISGAPAAGRGGDFTAGNISADLMSTTNIMYGMLLAPNYALAGTAPASPTVGPVNWGSGRTPNAFQWVSPDWSGFNARVGYSTSGIGVNDGDLAGAALAGGGTLRKGSSFSIVPEYIAAQWNVGFNYTKAKLDGVARDQRAMLLWGTVRFGGARVSLILGDQEATNVAPSAGAIAAGAVIGGVGSPFTAACAVAAGSTTNPITCSNKIADARHYQITGDYTMGQHVIAAAYSVAQDDKVIPGDQRAKQFVINYAYKLSNRTSVGVGYTRLTNGSLGAYSLTGATGTYVDGGAANGNLNGEDTSLWVASIKHSF